jgi:hypothetical protein
MHDILPPWPYARSCRGTWGQEEIKPYSMKLHGHCFIQKCVLKHTQRRNKGMLHNRLHGAESLELFGVAQPFMEPDDSLSCPHTTVMN